MYIRTPAALLLALSSSVSAYTLSNVTYASNNSAIQLFPVCEEQTARSCPGAWWNDFDPRFLNGVAKICGDPRENWAYQAPYMAFTFKGSAFYMYQWINSSVADQQLYLDNDKFHTQTLFDEVPNLTGDLQLMMTFSAENLDPLSDHTIGIQQVSNSTRGDTFIILDYIIVTQTTLDASDIPKKKASSATIAGGVVGGVLGLVALVLGCILLRRWNIRREAARHKASTKYEWQGEVAAPATIKFDPSSEIEASERIAREGREEEELEKQLAKFNTLTEHV